MILHSVRLVSALSSRRSTGKPSRFERELRRILRDLFSQYRPERHYMRGPGPACLARQAGLQQMALATAG